MNAQNYYPENANRAKAILVAGLVLIQVTLFAGENTTGKGTQNAANYTTEEATEKEIELEDWMYNTQNSFWYDLSNAKEPELAIEDWMCNTQNSFWYYLKEVKEPEIAIENWMTNPDAWTTTGGEVMLSSL